MSRHDGPALRFFIALITVTALPYLLFPLSKLLWTESASVASAREGLIFLGSSGHVAASFFFYGDSRTRTHMLGRRGRFLIAPLAVIAFTSAFFVFSGTALAYGICVYWIWQTHHYTRQNHGIASFVARATSQAVTGTERTALTLTGVAGVIGMTTFVAPYQDTVLEPFAWHLHNVALGTYAAAWLFYLASLWQGRGKRAPLRTAMLLVLMLFYFPLFLFEDTLSAVSTYAIAHGLQYLVFMGYVARVPAASGTRRIAALVSFALLGGSVLVALQHPGYFGDYRQAVYGAYLGLVMWHFLLDAGMWRLSEPFQRKYMAERFVFLQAPSR